MNCKNQENEQGLNNFLHKTEPKKVANVKKQKIDKKLLNY